MKLSRLASKEQTAKKCKPAPCVFLFCQQISLECVEVLRQLHALLLSLHELLQFLRNLHLLAYDAFYRFEEFSRMCSFQEHTNLLRFQILLQGTVTDRSVRIKKVFCSVVCSLDSFADLLICIAAA